jgi:hypothetical protein
LATQAITCLIVVPKSDRHFFTYRDHLPLEPNITKISSHDVPL